MVARRVLIADVRSWTLGEWNPGLLHWYLTLTGTGDGGQTVAQNGFGLAPNGSKPNGGNCFDDAISELPPAGSVQDWDFVNMTADTHPMHVHLVQFQVVHRRPAGTTATGVADGTGVLPFEKGWKDTVSAHPGLTTRIRMKFDVPSAAPIGPPSGLVAAGTSPDYNLQGTEYERTYVYHCHIVEHEDNDMMRPFRVA